MGKTKVFIDGGAGTTGLRIFSRLESREDIELMVLPEESRKSIESRREAINSSDVTILCLPDDASREAVGLRSNDRTVIIDTSTAFRTDPGWAYGFAELKDLRQRIKESKNIANPGCHASGFLALAVPLIENGILGKDARLSCFSLTGYSGGGKKMIGEYESPESAAKSALGSGRLYGISQNHKHLPEMAKIAGLRNPPVFAPVVVPHFGGMEVIVPLFASDVMRSGKLRMDAADIPSVKADVSAVFREYYNRPDGSGTVRFCEDADGLFEDAPGFIPSSGLEGRDDMLVFVFGSAERLILVALFDNLGKGASGAATQNMNISIGAKETEGLVIGRRAMMAAAGRRWSDA